MRFVLDEKKMGESLKVRNTPIFSHITDLITVIKQKSTRDEQNQNIYKE